MKRSLNAKCCICGGKIMSEEDLTVCENCNHIYHKLCWQEVKEECVYCNNKIKKEELDNENKQKSFKLKGYI